MNLKIGKDIGQIPNTRAACLIFQASCDGAYVCVAFYPVLRLMRQGDFCSVQDSEFSWGFLISPFFLLVVGSMLTWFPFLCPLGLPENLMLPNLDYPQE